MKTIFKFLLLIAAGTFIVLPPLPAAAQQTEKPVPAKSIRTNGATKSAPLQFSFSSASWTDVLEWFSLQADLSLQLDEIPTGTFTFSDPTRSYTVSEAMDVINLALMKRAYSLVRRGRMLQVIDLETENADKLISEIAELVRAEDLEERGKTDIVSCVMPLGSLTPDDAREELGQVVGPWGRVVVLDSARQVKVTETAEKLIAIRDLLASAARADTEVIEILLKHRSSDELLEIARPLLGFEPGETTSEDIRISVGLYGDRIYAAGLPGKTGLLQALIEKADQPLETPESDQEVADPILQTHPVTSADSTTVFDVLQTLLAGTPDARISIEPKTNAIIAWCRPETHQMINDTIAKMEGRGQEFKVIDLRRLDPAQALLTINKFFGVTEAGGEGPTVDGDPATGKLWVRGTAEQIALVQRLLAELEGSDSVGQLGDKVRILPYTGTDAQQALKQVQQVWSITGRKNQIRTIAPSQKSNGRGGIRERRVPREAPKESQEPSETARQSRDNAAYKTTLPSGVNVYTTYWLPSPPALRGRRVGDEGAERSRSVSSRASNSRAESPSPPAWSDANVFNDASWTGNRSPAYVTNMIPFWLPSPPRSGGEGLGERGPGAMVVSHESRSRSSGNDAEFANAQHLCLPQFPPLPRPLSPKQVWGRGEPVWKTARNPPLADAQPSSKREGGKVARKVPRYHLVSEPADPAADDASETNEFETTTISVGGADIIVQFTPSGMMIASEDLEALDAFESLMESFAEPSTAQSDLPTIIWLKYIKADLAAELISSILGGGETSVASAVDGVTSGFGGGMLGLLGLGGGGGGAEETSSSKSVMTTSGSVNIVPDARLNALIVQANPIDLRMIELILEKVDREESPEDVQTVARPQLIPVIYQDANDVAEVVKAVFGDRIQGAAAAKSTAAPPSPQEFLQAIRGKGKSKESKPTSKPSQISVAVDGRSNALVVVATPQDFEEVRELVETLDQEGMESEETIITHTMDGSVNPEVLRMALDSILGTESGGSPSDRANAAKKTNTTKTESTRAAADIQRRMEFFKAVREKMGDGGKEAKEGGREGRLLRGLGGGGRGGNGGGRGQ